MRTSILTDEEAMATLPRSWSYGEVRVCSHEREKRRTVPQRYSARSLGVNEVIYDGGGAHHHSSVAVWMFGRVDWNLLVVVRI